MSNPVSLFEQLNKIKPKAAEADKPRLELVEDDRPNSTLPNLTQDVLNQSEVSPNKDFTKVPNSITKKGIPEKLFKGLSKHTYDVLYRQTRGAVKPTRKIQLRKSEIMKLTGLSFNTVQTHIKYLKEGGLVKVEMIIGKHEGSVYEVLIPEEIPNPTQPNPTQHKTTQKTQPDTIQVLGILGLGNLVENKGTYEFPKTSLKTFEAIDDDSLTLFARAIDDASRKLTKKGLSKNDKEKWRELAELLIMELELAAARADSISNVPAFLTEHLRRRLTRKPDEATVQKFSKKGIGKSLKIGKTNESAEFDAQPYEAEPLTEQARETVLKTMRDYIAKGERAYVLNLQNSYTAEDWFWILENLDQPEKN